MPGSPKKRDLLRRLHELARERVGPAAYAVDYVEQYVRKGGSISRLTRDLAADLGFKVSRAYLNGVLYSVCPDAAERIERARTQFAWETRWLAMGRAHLDSLRRASAVASPSRQPETAA